MIQRKKSKVFQHLKKNHNKSHLFSYIYIYKIGYAPNNLTKAHRIEHENTSPDSQPIISKSMLYFNFQISTCVFCKVNCLCVCAYSCKIQTRKELAAQMMCGIVSVLHILKTMLSGNHNEDSQKMLQLM